MVKPLSAITSSPKVVVSLLRYVQWSWFNALCSHVRGFRLSCDLKRSCCLRQVDPPSVFLHHSSEASGCGHPHSSPLPR